MHVFLKRLQRPLSDKSGKEVPDMSQVITLDDYKEFFNNTRKATSSHPPLHYGHYKAACESDVLASVNLAFVNIPFKHGYPLSRWRHSLQKT